MRVHNRFRPDTATSFGDEFPELAFVSCLPGLLSHHFGSAESGNQVAVRVKDLDVTTERPSSGVYRCRFESENCRLEGVPEILENGGAAFATTYWSIVLTAQSQSPASQEALEQLCRVYWPPIYCFLRRQGRNDKEARDLTQR